MKHQMKASAYHLKPADIKKLTLAAANFRDRCIVKTLYWAGLRRHELAALAIRDVDFDRKRITVQNGKGGKTRIVPIIDDEYLSDLAHLIGSRKQDAVFLSNQDKALSLRSVNYIIEGVARRPRIENPNPRLQDLNPHIFRHSIARFLKSKGWRVDTQLPRASVLQNHHGHVRHHLD